MKINHLTFSSFLFFVFFTTGFAQVPNYVPTNGLVGWWPFTGNANDLSGNGNNGTVNGATLTTDRFGVANNAYNFNGIDANISSSGSHILLPNGIINNFQGTTISIWVLQTNLFTSCDQGGYGSCGIAAFIYFGDGGTNLLAISRSTNQINFSVNVSGANYTDNQSLRGVWTHFVLTFNNFVIKGFVNGIQVASTPYNSNLNFISNLNAISREWWSGGISTSTRFNGKIDDVGVWNRVLSNCEVQSLYQSQIVSGTATITPQSSTTFCQGGSVNLTASQGSTYLWSNGQTTQSISATTSGSYTVQVTDANGCVRTSAPTVVTVNPNPQVSISNNSSTTFCQGSSVTLTSTGASSYQWSNNQSGNSISVNTSGSFYTIGTDANGCTDTSNAIQVLVNPLPQVSISNNGSTIFCQGGTVTLTSTGANSYQWSNNQSGDSISVNTSGSCYSIGSDNNGCTDTSNAISVVVNPNPTAVITPSGPTSFCLGDSVLLNGVQGLNNTWSNGQTGTSIWVFQSGVYQLQVMDGNGCQDSSSVQINAFPLPQLSISLQGDDAFCQGNSTILIGSGSITYLWSTGDTTSSIQVNSSGLYSFMGTDVNGCTSSSNQIPISVIDYPVILTQPQDIQEQVGNNVVFSIGTQNTSNSFQWEGDLGLGFQTINNGGQYGGATTNQLTVSNITQNNNGQLFRCVVTNDICSVVSDTAILTIKPNSGFLDFSGGFTLNPNPTQNNITIQFQDPVNSNYSLLDFSGKELRIGKMEGKETTISVQSLPVGVYFIRIDGKQIRFIRN